MKRAAVVLLVVAAAVAALAAPAGAAKARTPGPLRVLLIGDSITFNYQDEAAAALAAKGYHVQLAGIVNSGLLDAEWCKGQLARKYSKLGPDVVIYQNAGNYLAAPPCKLPALAYPSEQFYRLWEKSARRSQRIFVRKGARFLWVLNPASGHKGYAPVIPRVNAIYRGLGTPTVDAWTAFGGATHNPSLHEADGIHLNEAGQQRMAELIAAAVG